MDLDATVTNLKKVAARFEFPLALMAVSFATFTWRVLRMRFASKFPWERLDARTIDDSSVPSLMSLLASSPDSD